MANIIPDTFVLVGWSRAFLNDTLNNTTSNNAVLYPLTIANPISNARTFRQTNPVRYILACDMELDIQGSEWQAYYTDSAVGVTFQAVKTVLDLSLYDVKCCFATIAIPSSGVWSLQDVGAVETNMFIVSVDEANNRLTLKLNPSIDTPAKWIDAVTLISNSNNARLIFSYEEKGLPQTIPITNVDNSTGFTNKTLFPSSASVGTPYTVSMDLPTGYIASITPHIKIEAGGNTLLDSDMNLSGNTYSYTYTFLQAYSGATVTYTGACAVASIPITNVDNSTGFTNKTLFPSSASVGTPYTVSMDLPTGYIASITPHIKIEAGGNTLLDSDMNLSGNTYSYTYTFLQAYSGATVTYTGACISSLDVSVVNVDNTEGFIDKTFAPTIITKGVSYRIEMYLPEWYRAVSTPYIRIYNTTGGIHSTIDQVNFIRDTSNSRHYYCNFGISTSQTAIHSIEIVYNGIAEDSRRDIIVTNIHDNLVNFNPAPTQINLKESVETKIVLTALEGYTYTVITPYAKVYIEGFDYNYLGNEIQPGVWEISITPPMFAGSGSLTAVVYFYGEVAEETELADVNPFVNTFKVTTNTLENLMRVRFAIISDVGQVTGYIDTAQFILSLYKPFMTIETAETSSTIFLGYLETEENAPLVKYTHTNVEITTTIKEYYHNALDYEATKITLYLPFHGMKDVDTSDVMGKTLTIHYRINNVNGKGVIYLLANENLFDSVTCDVKYETPIQQFTDSKLEGIIQAIDDSNEYQDLIPKIYINRAIPYSTNYNTFNKTDEMTVISDIGNGKIQADDITITTLATNTEVDEIKNILVNEMIIL